MATSSWLDLPWNELYRYINKCGSLHNMRDFSAEALRGLNAFVPFDQGLIYFLDGNHKVHHQYLLNIKDSWSNLYLDYYSKANLSQYGVSRAVREIAGKPFISIHHWNDEPNSEFISDYIKARGLQISLGFVLFDLNGVPRTVFALDRLTNTEFTDLEMDMLYILVPSLNNLHKNFYARPIDETDFKDNIWVAAGLTDREIEVANLLCQGVSPNNISSALHIAVSTTYKHIAHIYEKIGVSSLQELLVKVINSSKSE